MHSSAADFGRGHGPQAAGRDECTGLSTTICWASGLDVTDEGAGCRPRPRPAVDRFGRIDVLVNNAGLRPAGRGPRRASAKEVEQQFATNVFGLPERDALRILPQHAPRRPRARGQHLCDRRLLCLPRLGRLQRNQVRSRGTDRGDGHRARAARHPRDRGRGPASSAPTFSTRVRW